MTGWRIGWLVLPESFGSPSRALASEPGYLRALLEPLGAEAVFEAQAELGAALARYASNRAILLNELPSMGLDRFHPADGAFYLYLDVSRFTDDSLDFCGRMLNEIGVAATPGSIRPHPGIAQCGSLSQGQNATSSRRRGG